MSYRVVPVLKRRRSSQVGSVGNSVGAICAANSLKTCTGRGVCRLPRWTTERSKVWKRHAGMISTSRPSRSNSGGPVAEARQCRCRRPGPMRGRCNRSSKGGAETSAFPCLSWSHGQSASDCRGSNARTPTAGDPAGPAGFLAPGWSGDRQDLRRADAGRSGSFAPQAPNPFSPARRA